MTVYDEKKMAEEREKADLLELQKEKLFDAAKRGDLTTVKHLVEKENVTLTSPEEEEWKTIAHVAAENGHLNVVKYVSEKEPTILGDRDRYGKTILHVHPEKNAMDLIKYLEGKYPNGDLPEWDRRDFESTAIHSAVQFGHWNILKYFIEEKKSDVNATNDQGEPPIFTAVKFQRDDFFKYLVEERKANLTMVDNHKDNILFVAVTQDDLPTMKYVLDERKAAIDVNWQNEFHNTLVHRTAIQNRTKILEYLVEQKHADVNILGHENRTALSLASTRNNYDICKYLVEHGADVQLKDKFGFIPVQRAFDKKLAEYLQNISGWPRSRRSLTFQPVQLAYQSSQLRLANRLNSDGATSLDELYSSQLPNFLVVAGWIFRHKRKFDASFLSPSAMLYARMDPIAVDTVNVAPDFNDV